MVSNPTTDREYLAKPEGAFGTYAPPICARCYEHEFEQLKKPKTGNKTPHYYCDALIPTSCRRCAGWWEVNMCGTTVKKRVVLPAELVQNSSFIESVAVAHEEGKTKGQNGSLQLTHNSRYVSKEDAFYNRAILVVGNEIIKRERNGNVMCCSGPTITAWKPYKQDTHELPAEDGDDGLPNPVQDDMAERAEMDYAIERLQAGEDLVGRSPPVPHACDGMRTTSATRLESILESPEGEEEPNARHAFPRFPPMTEKPHYLHNNTAASLSEAKRQRKDEVEGLGEMTMSETQTKKMKKVADLVKKVVFNQQRVKEAMHGWERREKVLSKKYPEEYKTMLVQEAFNNIFEFGTAGVFIKSEVTGKDKPRVVVNHGPERLVVMARLAYVFDKVLFTAFKDASIKARTKRVAIEKALHDMNRIGAGWMIENDFSSFDFSISTQLKAFEREVLLHISNLLGVDIECDMGDLQSLLDERTMAMKWEMRTKNGKVIVELDGAMRDSGDRLTSSGNFYQNLLAWIEYMVDEEDVNSFLLKLIHNRGGPTEYKSARDGKVYVVKFTFEGDDTFNKTTEELKKDDIDAFFARRGFQAKSIVTEPAKGQGFATFVGWHALTHDGLFVNEGGFIMCPEIKRNLQTKDFRTSVFQNNKDYLEAIDAATMAECFKEVGPMYQFWRAQFEESAARAKCHDITKVTNTDIQSMKGVMMRLEGVDGEFTRARLNKMINTLMVCEPKLDREDRYRDLCRLAAGPFTDDEWACMSGMTSVKGNHGADNAMMIPASWLK